MSVFEVEQGIFEDVYSSGVLEGVSFDESQAELKDEKSALISTLQSYEEINNTDYGDTITEVKHLEHMHQLEAYWQFVDVIDSSRS